MTGRLPRMLAATGLIAVLAPPAVGGAAVMPPPVDEARLPPAGPPTPPQPTVQREDCAAVPRVPPAEDPGQLRGLDVPTVWALSRGAGQTVAVIDTGVARHRRLPHLVPGGDFVSTQDGTTDCDGHGTIVAGIIAASPDAGNPEAFTGIAPDVSLLAIRQSSNKFHAVDDSAGSGVGDVDTRAAAVRTAADLGATVINISAVACLPADADLDDRALGAALAYAVDVKNVVVVTAAGNVGGPGQCPASNPHEVSGADDVVTVASPAWYDDYVLTVGSVDPRGAPSSFSLAGPWVDVAAPGEGVVSLAPAADGIATTSAAGKPLSGTSYAAPVVSAIAALVRARSPQLTARQVMQRIEETAHPPAGGWEPTVGHGVVDALAAVSGVSRTRDKTAPTSRAVLNTGAVDSAPASRRVAVRGTLICLALTGGVAVISVAAGRLRRPERVPDQ